MSTLITPDRIIALKAKVKAECQRRKYNGSVAAYGGSDYDFVVPAAQGYKIMQEHYDKNSVPLSKINASKVPAAGSKKIIESEIANMESWVTSWATRSKTSSTSDCSASCTGLCAGCTACTSCSGCDGCSGCSGCGGCGGCNGECASDCETICS